MTLYSLKLRTAQLEDGEEKHRKEKHCAGAERMVEEKHILAVAQSLLERGINRGEAIPDFIQLKIEKVHRHEVTELTALPVKTIDVPDAVTGIAEMRNILGAMDLPNVSALLELLQSRQNMRGAILLDVDSLERLEPDKERGVRVTYMDADTMEMTPAEIIPAIKNHFREALVLATKVAFAPNIVGEICISDDPEYVTGYVASKEIGYVRITKLKEPGIPFGKRLFLYRGDKSEAANCIEYLENRKVLVKDVPMRPVT